MKTKISFLVMSMLIVTFSQGAILDSSRHKREASGLPGFVSAIGPGKQVDLLVMIDRSKGMGRDWFTMQEKPLIQQMLNRYAIIHPDFVRLSVITFAKSAYVPIDWIRESDTSHNTKCNLFYSTPPPWNSVVYDMNQEEYASTNLREAFSMGTLILNQGLINRPNATQIILLLTDGKYKDGEDPFPYVTALKDRGVEIYCVAAGPWREAGNIRELASVAENYGQYTEWEDLLGTHQRSTTPDTLQIWYRNNNQEYCDNSCDANSDCFCDVNTGYSQCQCKPGYYRDDTSGLCTECKYHTYKSDYGNSETQCLLCPARSVTSETGRTSVADCDCHTDAATCTEQQILDEALCEPGSSLCAEAEYCSNDNQAPFYHCRICKEGFFTDGSCDRNYDNCVDHKCENSGICMDSVNDYQCLCRAGYMGRYCELNVDECAGADMCSNGGTCVDGVNFFSCVCPPGYTGTFCLDELPDVPTTPNATDPTTTTIGTTTLSTPPASTLPPEEGFWTTTMIIIIAAASGGFIMLVVILSIVICCVMNYRRKQTEKEIAAVKEELNTLKRETKSSRYRKTITKTLSRAFSGIWKRKSVRGSHYDQEPEVKEGAPSAPPSRRPDLLGSEAGNEQEVVYMDQQKIRDGMAGWKAYLKEIYSTGAIAYGAIADIDGGKKAVSPDFIYDLNEIERVHEIIIQKKKNISAVIQDKEFEIWENDGSTATGRSASDSVKTDIILLGRTRKYVIILIADDDGSGFSQINKEMEYITDHIKSEGY